MKYATDHPYADLEKAARQIDPIRKYSHEIAPIHRIAASVSEKTRSPSLA